MVLIYSFDILLSNMELVRLASSSPILLRFGLSVPLKRSSQAFKMIALCLHGANNLSLNLVRVVQQRNRAEMKYHEPIPLRGERISNSKAISYIFPALVLAIYLSL
jgi:hypothetical protein